MSESDGVPWTEPMLGDTELFPEHRADEGRSDPSPQEAPDTFNPEPVDWRHLSPTAARRAWRALDAWVDWLRKEFGLPPQIVPPLWHRHRELVWELSALRDHFLASYEAGSSASGPIGWMADFADARERLRDWVQTCGTTVSQDRPTRVPAWPGEPPADVAGPQPVTDRRADFEAMVEEDVEARRLRGSQDRAGA